MLYCAWQLDFLKIIILPSKLKKIGQTYGYLNVLENLVNFFPIWPILKVYINFCMLGQISRLGKSWFLRYGPKCSCPIRLQNFKSTTSLEQNDEKAWSSAYWYKFIEIKKWLKNIGAGMVINGCAHSGCRTKINLTKKLME